MALPQQAHHPVGLIVKCQAKSESAATMFSGINELHTKMRVNEARGPRPFAEEVVVERLKRGTTVQERNLVHILNIQAPKLQTDPPTPARPCPLRQS